MPNGRITPQQAKAELARRELARRHLAHFGQYMEPSWTVARHQKLICEYLESVFHYIETHGQEGIGRLIIELPPQHTKTTWASRNFPAWLLGSCPIRTCC